MPTTDDILNYDGAVFTALEIEQVRAIAGLKQYSQAQGLLTPLIAEQRQVVRALIGAWDATGDGTVALKGGKDGLDYSQSRDKEEIRMQLRLMLGLSAFDPELDPRAASIVTIQSPWYEVDEGEF